jgi:hypothetical protein
MSLMKMFIGRSELREDVGQKQAADVRKKN